MIAWAVDTAIAVSVLILAVLLIRRPFASMFGARAAYALWLAPALRAVTPPLPTAVAPLPASPLGGSATYVLTSGSGGETAIMSPTTLTAALWLGGCLFFLAIHLWRHHRFLKDALASARPLDIPEVPYDVIASARVDGPMATGLTHPLILVPTDFQQRLTSEEQRFALWHEQLHHRHGDIWASAGALLLVSLLWFNPFAHLALGAFRRDMEAACDARLLAEAGRSAAPTYAGTILRCAARPVPRSLCALTSIDELKGRLTMLKLNHGRARRLAGMILASVIAVSGIATAGIAQDRAKEETQVFEKRIVIHKAGDKDAIRNGEPGELRDISTSCPGEKFEADSTANGTEKQNVKFVLCAAKGEKLLSALEKAEAEIQKRDDMPADRKAEILTKIRSKIDELRAKG